MLLAWTGPQEDPASMTANPPRGTTASRNFTTLMKSVGTMVVTIFVFGIVIWWLIVVLSKIGTAPGVNSKGAVTLDQYQRSKDILQIVFPLATAAVGYWFGNRGTARAQDQAHQAQNRLSAVLGASNEPDILTRAAASAPDAFREFNANAG
jgi:heme/copper-type cytochrome/quinol oxidase subunit 2